MYFSFESKSGESSVNYFRVIKTKEREIKEASHRLIQYAEMISIKDNLASPCSNELAKHVLPRLNIAGMHCPLPSEKIHKIS